MTQISKLPISVFIVAQDEEAHIEKVLQSVQCMDEVILVDSGSTDRTLEIAKKYDVKIYHHAWQGYAKQKQYAMSLCSNEWVLNLDGDEVLNPSIIARFKQIIENDECDSVRFWRNDWFIGQRLSRFTKRPNNHRLYKKSKSRFDETNLAHESAIVDGKELFINEEFDHFGYSTVEVITQKNNQYSTLKAQEKFNKSKRYSTLKLLLIFPITFLQKYLIHGQCFSGRRGFILAVMASYYAFMKEAKLYQLWQSEKKSLNCGDKM
ncbi:glycosyltransferase family 2 protein [Flocculibacter collagenilyticus]|uniref:glycosyltransferase family 2 protein n=1 Tax=Flocculibacter collagenilyticus TaxID=2744479 RepID=UPI0018F5DFBF|nr:glycosyltransferase family 2 protein [Flocculibacter collagenilyticus]